MDNFGEYITKEYGILKKILKHLPFRDLLTARKVCRDWCKAVNVIFLNEFGKTPEVFFSENTLLKKEEIEFWNDAKSVPDVVIKFYANGSETRFSVLDDVNLLSNSVFDCGTFSNCTEEEECLEGREAVSSYQISPTFLHFGCEGTFSFSSRKRNDSKDLLHSSFFDTGASSTFSLPKTSGVHYYVFALSMKDYKNLKSFNLKEFENGQDKGPVRCILLYDNSFLKYCRVFTRLLHYLVNTVRGQQSTEFAFGGGKVKKISWWKSNNQKTPDVCGVVIRGENVMAYSNVLEDNFSTENMDDFFKDVSKTVGPIPKGAHRVALLAQCVDRPHAHKRMYPFPEIDVEVLELKFFNDHFPDIPVCGFLAGGEYGFEAASHKDIDKEKSNFKKLRNDIEFSVKHWQSTSIVILTYLEPLK